MPEQLIPTLYDYLAAARKGPEALAALSAGRTAPPPKAAKEAGPQMKRLPEQHQQRGLL